MKIPTEPFSVTITEEDRLDAGDYSQPSCCLIATALKRIGYTADQIGVGVYEILLYDPDIRASAFIPDIHMDDAALCGDGRAYLPEVVGRTFTFAPTNAN
jgi:hypothetical protein